MIETDLEEKFSWGQKVKETLMIWCWSFLASIFGMRWLIDHGKQVLTQYRSVHFYSDTHISPRCAQRPLPACLTIDDAPGDPQMMHALLDVLKDNNIQVTFFIVSGLVDSPAHEDVLRRIVKEGHSLGNHMTRDMDYCTTDEKIFEDDLLECEALLAKYHPNWDLRGKWFRPPCAKLAGWMLPILARHKYRTVLADVYANDVAAQSCKQWVVDFHAKHVTSGSVIVVHCPEFQRRFRPSACFIVKHTVAHCLRSGMSFVDLLDLFPEESDFSLALDTPFALD